MAFTMGERPKRTSTVEFGKYAAAREYWFSGSLDECDALRTVGNAAPATIPGVGSDGSAIVLFKRKVAAKEEGGGAWTVNVDWDETPDQFELKVNNGIQTAKMFQAFEQVRVYDCIDGGSLDGPGGFGNVPDFANAIGVKGDGLNIEVEGLENEIGKFEFSITRKSTTASLDAAYTAYLANVTPSVNRAVWSFVWRGQTFAFAKGSVKFRGCTTNESSTNLEITHNFAYSKGSAADGSAWRVDTTYALGDQVNFDGYIWASLENGNVANEPFKTPWDEFTNYAEEDQVVRQVLLLGASDLVGFIYESLADGNIGHVPEESPGNWDEVGVWHWLPIRVTNEITVGNSGPIVKEGWEYADPWYRPTVAGGIVLPTPTGVRILRVSEYSDFGQLQCFV